MHIPQYILQLIALRNSIILPGFGEFYIDDSMQSRPEEDGTFTPQKEVIRFNPGTKANDYVLAKYVAEKEGLSVTAGNEMVKNYVEQALKTMQSEKQWTINGLGTCWLETGSDTPLFSNDQVNNIAEENYGLPTVTLSPKSSANHEKPALVTTPPEMEPPIEEAVQPKDESSGKEDFLPAEGPGPDNTTHVAHDSTDKNDTDPAVPIEKAERAAAPPPEEKKNKRKYIFLIILIALLTSMITLGIWKQEIVTELYDNASAKIRAMVQTKQDNKPNASDSETLEQKADKELHQPLTNAVDTIHSINSHTTLPKTTPSIKESTRAFVIMAAAFGNKANAERMVKALQEEGFSDATIDGKTASGLWRVAAGYYATEREALSVIKEGQKEDKLKNAFVAPIQ